MTQNELIEFLARVESSLRADMAQLAQHLSPHTDTSDHGMRLSWGLAHLQGSFTDFHRDLERLQKELSRGTNAGTKIQNKLRRDDIQD